MHHFGLLLDLTCQFPPTFAFISFQNCYCGCDLNKIFPISLLHPPRLVVYPSAFLGNYFFCFRANSVYHQVPPVSTSLYTSVFILFHFRIFLEIFSILCPSKCEYTENPSLLFFLCGLSLLSFENLGCSCQVKISLPLSFSPYIYYYISLSLSSSLQPTPFSSSREHIYIYLLSVWFGGL